MTTTTPSEGDAHAVALLDKIRTFTETLSSSERELFAVLLGPGVETLMAPEDSGDEVVGFGHVPAGSWQPGSLRDRLATAVTNSEWQLVERL